MTNRPAPAAPPGAGWRAGVAAMVDLLGPLDQHIWSDRERIDAIDALRGLIAAAGAAQVRLTAAYAASQRALGASARGVAAEVGFAQRVGIAQAQRLVASACTLATDLPETLELVAEGELSVERARVVADRVADAEPEVRHVVDERICHDVDRLADRQVRDAVDAIVMEVDADHIEQRRLAAFQRRRVSVRPVGDGMAWLSILTSLVDAHLAEQALRQHADRTLAQAAQAALAAEEAQAGRAARAAHATAAGTAGGSTKVATPPGADAGGGARPGPGPGAGTGVGGGVESVLSQGAVMADAAIDRLSGRVEGVGPTVAVHLVMTPDTLTGTGPGRDLPAHVLGVGPLPARAARDLLKVRVSPAAEASTSPVPRVMAQPQQLGTAPTRAGDEPSSHSARDAGLNCKSGADPNPGLTSGSESDSPTGVDTSPAAGSRATASSNLRSASDAGSDSEPVARLNFDDGAWLFSDVTPEQRRVEGEQVRRQVRRDTREQSRVTVRRIFVDVDGRTVTGMDARAGVMPAPFRARLADPDGDHDGAMTAWLSLLRSPPTRERLVPLESMARLFIGLLRQFMLIRDKTCRAPWCGALIRHIDHAHPWAHGGATSAINGNGDCAGHNLAKESPGYRVRTTWTWHAGMWWQADPEWAADLSREPGLGREHDLDPDADAGWAPDLALDSDPWWETTPAWATCLGSETDPERETPSSWAESPEADAAFAGLPALPHTVTWVTPTGRKVSGTAPPPLGWGTELADSARARSERTRHGATVRAG